MYHEVVVIQGLGFRSTLNPGSYKLPINLRRRCGKTFVCNGTVEVWPMI